MEYQDIIFEVKEGYAVLTFNKPKKLNALGERMKKEIADVLDVVDGDSSIRGLIITGSGRGFMAGPTCPRSLPIAPAPRPSS